MIYTTVHQVLAQGNFVLAVSEGTFGDAPTAYYDLWRVENGKIAENDYNISVSSYVEQPDTREEVDIDELNKRIAEIVARQNVLRTAIDAIVATL